MPAEPSILFIGHGAERSGPPVYLRSLQGWLRGPDGPSVEFSTVLVRGGALLEDFRALGEVRVLDDRWTAPRVAQAAVGRLRDDRAYDRIRDLRYRARLRNLPPHDLVYVNSASAGCLHVAQSVVRRGTRLVTHVHELNVGLGYHLTDDERAFLFGRTDHFLAVSGAVRDELVERHGVPPAKITMAPGFVDTTATVSPERVEALRARLAVPSGAPVVVASGMTDWRKAPDLFLRVAWEQRRLAPALDAHYLWVGGDRSGPNWWPLDHDRRHLGLEGRVHFLGVQASPRDAFAAADVFALTAREDAYPLACLEAGALAVPCVSFDNGGLPELLRACDGGVVVPYGDTAALAQAVVDLLGDEPARAAMGSALADAVRSRHEVTVAAPSLWERLRDLGRD